MPTPPPQLVADAGGMKPWPSTCTAQLLPFSPGLEAAKCMGSGRNVVPTSGSLNENHPPPGVTPVTRIPVSRSLIMVEFTNAGFAEGAMQGCPSKLPPAPPLQTKSMHSPPGGAQIPHEGLQHDQPGA